MFPISIEPEGILWNVWRSAAHQAGVVHGYLTPNNVLVAKDGRIVITDFRFSTHLHPPSKDSDQQLSLAPLGGTLGFAAPAQVSPAFCRLGSATDIYAIGGQAYYLLTGRPLMMEVIIPTTIQSIGLDSKHCATSFKTSLMPLAGKIGPLDLVLKLQTIRLLCELPTLASVMTGYCISVHRQNEREITRVTSARDLRLLPCVPFAITVGT